MKCKRHKWQLADESCWDCGSYTEYYEREGCYGTRYLTSTGKEVERDGE